MDSADQTLTVPDSRPVRRSRSPAAALLKRVRLGSSRSLSQRRSQLDASSPEASGPERNHNNSSDDEHRGPAVFRSMRRQLRNRLLRSRHKKSTSGSTGAEQAVADWLDQSESGSGRATESDRVRPPLVPGATEDEVDADIEFDEDEHASMPVSPDDSGGLSGDPVLPDRTTKEPGTIYEVVVHLISGSQLVIRDSSGTSDPYVRFKYNGKVLERSKIVRKTLNPIWDEYFVFYVDSRQKPLEVKVYDYDKIYDDYMGQGIIDLSAMEIDKNQELTLELEDETGKSKEKFMGTVRLACRLSLSNVDSETMSTVSTTRVAFSSYAAKAKCSSGIPVDLPTSKKAALVLRGLRSAMDVSKRFKGTNWIATVTITLIEGKDLLAMDDNGLSDPFVKFRLGNDKCQSKVKRATLNPRWLEQFDLRLSSDESPRAETLEITVWDRDSMGRADFMGRASLPLASLERERTHMIDQPLEDGAGSLRLLVTISGSFEPDSVTDLRNYMVSEVDRQQLLSKYNFFHSFSKMSEVGWLQVKVLKAEGLSPVAWSGKIDAFVVVDLVNSRLQTHTVYRSTEPEWNKVFVFHVHDIHSVLEITVFDEEREKKSEELGCVSIPLLRIRNGEKRWYALKDRKHRRRKGQIMLEMDFIYNYIKAVWRTFNPKETKYALQDTNFKFSEFNRRIERIGQILDGFITFGNFVESCFAWESSSRSVTAFISFMVAVWTFEPYMLPLTLVIVFAKEYFHGLILAYMSRRARAIESRRMEEEAGSPIGKEAAFPGFNASNRRHNSHDDGNCLDLAKVARMRSVCALAGSHIKCTCLSARETAVPPSSYHALQENSYPVSTDEETKLDKDSKQIGISERFRNAKYTLELVQEFMGSLASFFERVHNTFTWCVPWLSVLAVICLVIATFILYYIPVRWLAMAWGINKFSKKLLRPHAIDNNEVFDFISRAPSDVELLRYKELKPELIAAADKRR